MEAILEKMKPEDRLVSTEKFVLSGDRAFPMENSEKGKIIIHAAEQLNDKSFPLIFATLYMRFAQNGDRSAFETLYFERRRALLTLLLAECIEKKGRFLNKIIDLSWAITEETSWIVPAHFHFRKLKHINPYLPEPFGRIESFVDLFSAETAAFLATVYYFLREQLEQMGCIALTERIVYEIDRRVIQPFLTRDDMGWMGFNGVRVNNWNPWIVSNILSATALTVSEIDVRKQVVAKSTKCLDNFIGGYLPDGGCDEGPGYWNAAGGSLFDALEIITDMTGGNMTLFDSRLKNIMEYICKVHINSSYFVSYGDNHRKVRLSGEYIYRMGKAFKSTDLQILGEQSCKQNIETSITDLHHPVRIVKNLMTDIAQEMAYLPSEFMLLPDMQFCAFRQKGCTVDGFYTWLKGGNNGESHNHNDVGSVGVYLDGEPLIVDLGIGEYTRSTFNQERYTLFPIRGCDHNLPLIDGKGEIEGREYQADFFRADEEKKRVSISVKGAYENKADILKFERELSLENDSVCICDDMSFVREMPVKFHFYCVEQPEIKQNGILSLGGKALFRYDERLQVSIEKVFLEDRLLARDWGDIVYRMVFSLCDVKDVYVNFYIDKEKNE